MSGVAKLAVLSGLSALAVVVAAIVTGCHFKVGPFVDGDAFCDGSEDGGKVGDPACPDGTHCAFPAPGWRPRCMEGQSEIDSPPPEGFKRNPYVDAGR